MEKKLTIEELSKTIPSLVSDEMGQLKGGFTELNSNIMAADRQNDKCANNGTCVNNGFCENNGTCKRNGSCRNQGVCKDNGQIGTIVPDPTINPKL